MPHATRPFDITRMPPGIPYIVGNEAAERFSYYGMRAILVVYMTDYLRSSDGALDLMSEADARAYYHLFSSGVYLFPMLGALIADALLGKFRTIVSMSLVYCAGHLALALGDTGLGVASGLSPRSWLVLGLTLIAIGSGGIKPCVSAHVGDQFGARNQQLLPRVFGWFYFSINLGALLSQLAIPLVLERLGPSVAFGIPGLLMGLATCLFWMGSGKFVHIPPAGRSFLHEVTSSVGLRILIRLSAVYLFVAVFWSLFDQMSSAWVLQAKRMDLDFLGISWLPSQIQAVNPLLILLFVPLFTYWIYPTLGRWFELTALRKMSFGFFLTIPAFALSTLIELWLEAGARVNIGWQILAFIPLTAAEVLISITCLEFSYTQAPNRMKSFVMSLYFLSVTLGNAFTAAVNFLIQNPDGSSRLTEAQYYAFFSLVMAAAAFGFLVVAKRFRGHTYVQGSDPA